MIVDLINFFSIIYTTWVNFLMNNNTALVALNILMVTFAVYMVASKKHGVFAN